MRTEYSWTRRKLQNQRVALPVDTLSLAVSVARDLTMATDMADGAYLDQGKPSFRDFLAGRIENKARRFWVVAILPDIRWQPVPSALVHAPTASVITRAPRLCPRFTGLSTTKSPAPKIAPALPRTIENLQEKAFHFASWLPAARTYIPLHESS